MSQPAPVSAWDEQRHFHLRPWREALSAWHRLATQAEGATLYHREPWLRLLCECYGFELSLAAISDGHDLAAGCLLARPRSLLGARRVSLPFSDLCPPLALDHGALKDLLAGLLTQGSCELRGIDPGPPWHISDCFLHWSLDLRRSRAALERAADRNFRRQVRHAAAAGVEIVIGQAREDIDAFHALQVETRRRLGLLAQPRRFFHLARSIFPKSALQVWSARFKGRTVAAVVVLREGERLHAKWAARTVEAPAGANHLLFWSVVEHYAGSVHCLDLGRSDRHNSGLNRFKRELGAQALALPYAFYPRRPRYLSAEITTGALGLLAVIIRRLPRSLCNALGATFYRYLG
ncbi:MAG TPA: GNAT family N-acetyltransferase [Candidatus Binataceae bacterium]|nr:GNAT family N-acetyltransferase [Candidatus Binataceae bacterium]